MKKYLINGAMALIVGGFIVSCSHDDISQTATVDQMTKSFNEMFTELYGPIAPNHNWGFETIAAEEGEDEATETEAAGTRTTQKEKHRWGKEGGIFADLAEPTPLTEAERADVANYFATTQFSDRGITLNWTEYYVEWVYNVANTSAKRRSTGEEWQQDITFDKICVSSTANSSGYEEILDWNGNNYPTYYMYETVNTDKFRAHISYVDGTEDDKWTTKFTIREYKGNYYVGFDLDVTKQTDGVIDLGQKTLGYYNDFIIRLIPGKGQNAKQETTTTITRTYKEIVDLGRVFCEDIATAAMKVTDDVDYNDIVFDARVWEVYDQDETTINGIPTTSDKKNIKYQYDICMLAAGGTIPETVGVNNVDVHDAFGVGLTFMVNTWTENSKAFGQYNTPTNVMHPKEEVIYYTLDYNDPAQVEKYKLNKDNVGIKSIPIKVLYKNGYQSASVALENEIEEESVDENGNKIFTSNAPYKICVPVGTLWPIERVNIRDAYTAFGDYVKDGSTEFYGNSSTQVGLNLYEKAPESKILSDFNKGLVKGTTVLVSESSSSSTVDVVWEGNVSDNGTAITLYNFDFKQGQTLRFFGSGTITVVCGSGSGTGVITNGSMEAGFVDVTIRDADVASKLSQGIQVSGSNFSLTKIVVL